MPFDRRKTKNSHSNDNFWTAYSDLFLGLSAIFLLLYVTSSLRTGTNAIKFQVENQKMAMKVTELQNQLKMYESVKNEYMQKNAAKDEVQEYQELLDKLVLLEDDSKNEKNRLAKEALENDKKAKALNKYQQMIRNVLNANKVAKSRIISRDDIIGEQIEEITVQKTEIGSLQSNIQDQKKLLAENTQKWQENKASLEKNISDLQREYQQNKISKKILSEKIDKIKQENEEKQQQLQAEKQEYEKRIQAESAKINELNRTLASTQGSLQASKEELSNVQTQAKGLQVALQNADKESQRLNGMMKGLEQDYLAQKQKDRAEFNGELKKLKLTAAQKAKREGKFKEEMAQKERALQSKLSGLQSQLQETSGALSRAKEEIDARKEIAKEIQRGFSSVGVKAEVDAQTGEVLLDFGDAYFDNDSANLKSEMRRVIEKVMPVYSQSLFGNPKISEKISAVEVIGFASPTYKGKYIDPKSEKLEDREALKYNMDLSYRRANSIFTYLIDNQKVKYAHQKDLVAKMKVSGRSFLEVMKVNDRTVSSAEEFCKLNDCKKSQRVIVRFSMDGKK